MGLASKMMIPVVVFVLLMYCPTFASVQRVAAVDSCTSGFTKGYASFDKTRESHVIFDEHDNPPQFEQQSFTIETWVMDSNPSQEDQVIYRYRYYGVVVAINTGKLRFGCTNDGGGATLETPVTPSVWHHVAATRDNNGTMILYVDGEKKGETVHTAPVYYLRRVLSYSPFMGGVAIGRDGNSSTSYFNGGLAEFRFWSRALSQTAVQLLMGNSIHTNHGQASLSLLVSLPFADDYKDTSASELVALSRKLELHTTGGPTRFCGQPSMMFKPKVAAIDSNSVKVVWSPPALIGAGPLSYYLVYYEVGKDKQKVTLQLSNKLNHILDVVKDTENGKLQRNKTYRFAIYARNRFSISGPESDYTTFTVKAPKSGAVDINTIVFFTIVGSVVVTGVVLYLKERLSARPKENKLKV